MHGWDFTEAEILDAIRSHRLLNPAMELATNACPWNCPFCFTEAPDNPAGQKRRLQNELTLEERLSLIDQAADLGTRTINFVGAGEPTIDPYFWTLLERMVHHGITPIVYSEGALRLSQPEFVRRLKGLGATVVLKMNSLHDEEYQDSIVAGESSSKSIPRVNYTRLRNRALDLLLSEGFAAHEPTRLAFDTIVTKRNISEIVELHRFARDQNIFVLLIHYLPSGRSTDKPEDAITKNELFALFGRLADIDKVEYGIEHRATFPYAGGVPCSIRGLGLYTKIQGLAFDCPGELHSLGNVRTEPLAEVWQRVRPITQHFNGGCLPRELAWRRLEQENVFVRQDGRP